jgi:hypothetical protein
MRIFGILLAIVFRTTMIEAYDQEKCYIGAEQMFINDKEMHIEFLGNWIKIEAIHTDEQ